MATRVIIIGHNYMSRLSLIRAYGSIGCEIVVICISYGKRKKQLDGYSRYVSQYFYTDANNEMALKDLLLSISVDGKKALLVPCSDFTAVTIDKYRNILERFYYVPGIVNSKSVFELMQKKVQKEIADSLQIKNAKSWSVIISDNGDYGLPKEITYPCFPKAELSISGGKVGMEKCNNESELRKNIAELIFYKCKRILIEQYLEIEKEYALIGFSDGDNVYIPGILYLKELAHGRHKGVAVAGELQPIGDMYDLIERYSLFVKQTRFVGLFDIDFFLCNDGYYFGEMNMRIGASGDAYIKNGINLPSMMLKYFLNEDIHMSHHLSEKIPFVNERIAVMDWYSGYSSTSVMKQYINSIYGFIKSIDDPLPYKMFCFDLLWMRIKKTIKSKLNR